jgi:hypothetical protein
MNRFVYFINRNLERGGERERERERERDRVRERQRADNKNPGQLWVAQLVPDNCQFIISILAWSNNVKM